MVDEMRGGAVDGIVGEFATYEDYLDSQISPTDLYYLEDEDLARQLVELGYRGSGETLKREEFEARKKAVEQARQNKLRAAPKALASAAKDVGSRTPYQKAIVPKKAMKAANSIQPAASVAVAAPPPAKTSWQPASQTSRSSVNSSS